MLLDLLGQPLLAAAGNARRTACEARADCCCVRPVEARGCCDAPDEAPASPVLTRSCDCKAQPVQGGHTLLALPAPGAERERAEGRPGPAAPERAASR